jgi:hypothetical protein
MMGGRVQKGTPRFDAKSRVIVPLTALQPVPTNISLQSSKIVHSNSIYDYSGIKGEKV